MKNKVKKIIEEEIKPSLQAHGGDIELVSVDEKKGIVKVRLRGACIGCPMAQVTMKQGIEAYLKKNVPGVKKVVSAD